MCGIAGIFNLHGDKESAMLTLKKMVAIMHHRGPDGAGFYCDEEAGLGHARLSIIDLTGGGQPIHNEDRSIWITFNGEIFNYRELRKDLLARGHEFYTESDTEVIVHLYEDYGVDCLEHLNGQFAFAIWNKNTGRLFMARDRVGIRPLFYTFSGDQVIFASEIKALFMDRRVKREIDPYALDQIFTFWMTIPPRTAFKNIFEIPAGHYMTVEAGSRKLNKYWDMDFTPDSRVRAEVEWAEELRELLTDATRLQLRADVPVGAYLSGGLDSSVITALIKKSSDTSLRTFSVTFEDEAYDERVYQREIIEYLDTVPSDIRCTYSDIGRVFPDVIWHTEKPVLRTASAPLYLLSGLVREKGYKVVLTGEGADEILAGYDIFKETKVRRFMERFPDSKFRPLILKKLYPYLAHSPVKSVQYAEEFFKTDTAGYPDEYYSHFPRWNTTSKTKLFFSDAMKESLGNYSGLNELSSLLPDDVYKYDYLSKSQYIESKTLLPGYILSSQGDRMAMAHSVEGRFPFLDHRVIGLCCKMPPNIRMNALKEKYILRESMKDLLPASTLKRTKQPYMAPDAKSFFSGDTPCYLDELLSERNLQSAGYFNPKAVSVLADKCRKNAALGFKDNMAAVGVISTMLLHDMFIDNFDSKSKGAADRAAEDKRYAIKV
ncbi:MAG: asparagine synthase (glutamine-hydrolyzing) [Nitrospirae bacterium]|nr:asparagine synthase (glutamine-hydrolyzing) [Nitrospirota bacterium]